MALMNLDDLHDPDFDAWLDARRDEAIAHQDAAQRAIDAQHRAQRCALADDVDGCERAHAEALFWATTA